MTATPQPPTTYHIRLEGRLDPTWGDWFGGVHVTVEPDGNTLLTCQVADRAALYGLLRQLRDLDLPLISLVRVTPTQPHSTLIQDEERPTMRYETFPTHAENSIARPQLYARLAGLLYIVIAIASAFPHFILPDQLIVAGDAAATTANITASRQMFLVNGIGGELVILLSETILLVLLYALFTPVNKTLSLLAATARLLMTAVHGVNLLNYVFVRLLVSPAFGAAFEAQQVQALVMMFIEAHSTGFTLGIAFLVIHMVALGILIYQSGYLPRILGVFFLVAALAYLFDTTAHLFVSSYTDTIDLIAMIIIPAEIALPLWLLVRGVRVERKQAVAATSATYTEATVN